MKQIELGDMISYKTFCNGVNVTQVGMVSSEKKQINTKFYKSEFGYEVLNEKNEVVWVLESYIE